MFENTVTNTLHTSQILTVTVVAGYLYTVDSYFAILASFELFKLYGNCRQTLVHPENIHSIPSTSLPIIPIPITSPPTAAFRPPSRPSLPPSRGLGIARVRGRRGGREAPEAPPLRQEVSAQLSAQRLRSSLVHDVVGKGTGT